MKKLLAVLLLVLALLLSSALAESARVTDNADVLTADQENALETAISVIRNTYSFDVVILTEDSIGSRRTDDYSDLYYANGGFGYGENHDGIMLLLVTGGGEGNRDYYIMNTGRGEKIFTDSVMYDMEDNMLPHLRFSDYYGGISQFVIDVQHRLEGYKPLNRAGRLLPVTMGVGLVVGLIVSLVLRGQMKTVRRKQNATSYVRDGSFQLTRVQDLYLYTTTTRRKIETASSSSGRSGGGGGFTGSSGMHHTGHGGKF